MGWVLFSFCEDVELADVTMTDVDEAIASLLVGCRMTNVGPVADADDAREGL
jgi:hypothetical protein